MCVEDIHAAVEYHVLVGVVGLAVVKVALLAVGGLKLGDDPPLLCEAGVMCTKPLQRPGDVKADEEVHDCNRRQMGEWRKSERGSREELGRSAPMEGRCGVVDESCAVMK